MRSTWKGESLYVTDSLRLPVDVVAGSEEANYLTEGGGGGVPQRGPLGRASSRRTPPREMNEGRLAGSLQRRSPTATPNLRGGIMSTSAIEMEEAYPASVSCASPPSASRPPRSEARHTAKRSRPAAEPKVLSLHELKTVAPSALYAPPAFPPSKVLHRKCSVTNLHDRYHYFTGQRPLLTVSRHTSDTDSHRVKRSAVADGSAAAQSFSLLTSGMSTISGAQGMMGLSSTAHRGSAIEQYAASTGALASSKASLVLAGQLPAMGEDAPVNSSSFLRPLDAMQRMEMQLRHVPELKESVGQRLQDTALVIAPVQSKSKGDKASTPLPPPPLPPPPLPQQPPMQSVDAPATLAAAPLPSAGVPPPPSASVPPPPSVSVPPPPSASVPPPPSVSVPPPPSASVPPPPSVSVPPPPSASVPPPPTVPVLPLPSALVPPPPPQATVPTSDGAVPAAPSVTPQSSLPAPAEERPASPSLPILHASLEVLSSAQQAAVEELKLIHHLYSISHDTTVNQQQLNEYPLTPLRMDNAVTGGSSTDWLLTGALYGWRPPPCNVMLPDPQRSLLENTWVLEPQRGAREVQQAAAISALSNAVLAHVEPSTPCLLSEATEREAAARVTGSADPCLDYHAPFQNVNHPEWVEQVPNIAFPSNMKELPEHAKRQQQHTRVSPESLSSTARDSASEEAASSLAAQAVLIHDPLSVLACEHLREETLDVVERRRAYLIAMDAANRTVSAASAPPISLGAMASVLEPAPPPGEVFCELSYPAKVLLSTVLYIRALGGLPSLLRAGPLTEYSPIVDKENCIELVFYNPSPEEQMRQERQQQQQQEAQLARQYMSSLQNPVAFSLHRNGSTARQRHRASSVQSDRRPPSLEGVHLHGSTLGYRSTSAAFGGRTQPRSTNVVGGDVDDPVMPRGNAAITPPPSRPPLLQSEVHRRPSEVEDRLMRTLSAVVCGLDADDNNGGGGLAMDDFAPATGESKRASVSHSSARGALGITLRPTNSSFLSPMQRSASSVISDDNRPIEDGEGSIAAHRAWVLRPSGRGSSSPADHSELGSQHGGTAVEQQRRASEYNSGIQMPSISSEVASVAQNSRLRRSSVSFAMEDLRQQQAKTQEPSPHKKTQGTNKTSLSATKSTAKLTRKAVDPFASTVKPRTPPSPSFQALPPADPAKGGRPRFDEERDELCVVLRAVVAQKSSVYSFGKAETVHVLPPLPRVGMDDEDAALLRQQAKEKAVELERLAVKEKDPLYRLLHNGPLAPEAAQRKAAQVDRARRISAALRRNGPVTVNEDGIPTADDYGDLMIAFLLSGGASELSGAAPDVMELETLRYRIFTLQGYSVSDPFGIHAAGGPMGNAQLSSSSKVPGLHHPTAMHRSSSSSSAGGTRSPVRQRRPSAFEEFSRQSSFFAAADGMGEHDLRHKKEGPRLMKDIQDEFQAKYPLYRASSVAESTLQAYFAESKANSANQRRRERSPSRSRAIKKKGVSSQRETGTATRTTNALHEIERDLLRFRPMNLNGFYGELVGAVQYALELQVHQHKEKVMQAFHM